MLLHRHSTLQSLIHALDASPRVNSFVVALFDVDTVLPDALTVPYRLGAPLKERLPDLDMCQRVVAKALTKAHWKHGMHTHEKNNEDQGDGQREAMGTGEELGTETRGQSMTRKLAQGARGLTAAEIRRAIDMGILMLRSKPEESTPCTDEDELMRALQIAPRLSQSGAQAGDSGRRREIGQGSTGAGGLVGVTPLLQEVMAITRDACHPNRTPDYDRLHIRPCSGVLISGPPGSGKTAFAREIAAQAQPYFSYLEVSCAELVHKTVGASEKNISDLFDMARKQTPTFLLFDNIDVLLRAEAEPLQADVSALAMDTPHGGSSTYGHETPPSSSNALDGATKGSGTGGGMYLNQRTAHKALDRLLSVLLMEIDGLSRGRDALDSMSGGAPETVVVLATCTEEHVLDRALLRPGRLEHRVRLGLPDTSMREALVAHFLDQAPPSVRAKVSASHTSEALAGCTVAEIKGSISSHIFRHVADQIQAASIAC